MTIDRYKQVKQLTACNTRVINCKYLGPTNTQGSRIKISDHHFKESVTIPYDYSFSNALEGAVNYLIDKGFDVVGFNSECHKTEYIIIIKNWNSEQSIK